MILKGANDFLLCSFINHEGGWGGGRWIEILASSPERHASMIKKVFVNNMCNRSVPAERTMYIIRMYIIHTER